MAPVDVNRLTSGLTYFDPQFVNEVLKEVRSETSVVGKLATPIAMPSSGASIPVLLSVPEPTFVGETELIPVANATFNTKSYRPYKATEVLLFSNEFLRDKAALYDAIMEQLPIAFGNMLDRRTLLGPSPGSGFDTLATAPSVRGGVSASAYEDYLSMINVVSAAGGSLKQWILSTAAEVVLLGARSEGDAGVPLFLQNPAADGSVGYVFARPVAKKDDVIDSDTSIGFAGDFSKIRYGFSQNMTFRISLDGTFVQDGVTISCAQRDMFGVIVSYEVGVMIPDPLKFVRITRT